MKQHSLGTLGAPAVYRACDLMLVLPALALLSPVIGLIAAIARLAGNRPIFTAQIRTGWFEREVTVWNFGLLGSIAEKRSERPLRLLLTLARTPELFAILEGKLSFFEQPYGLNRYIAYYNRQDLIHLSMRFSSFGIARTEADRATRWSRRQERSTYSIDINSARDFIAVTKNSIGNILVGSGMAVNSLSAIRPRRQTSTWETAKALPPIRASKYPMQSVSARGHTLFSPRRAGPSGSLTVIRTTRPEAWNAVLRSIGNYDFYDTCEYHALEEKNNAAIGELLVYSVNRDLLALPTLVRKVNTPLSKAAAPLWDATSVYGYSGWLASAGATADSEAVKTCRPILEEYLRGRNFVSIFSRLHPLRREITSSLKLGEVEMVGKTVGIPLDPRQELKLSKSHRYEIKKLRELGCEVIWDRNGDYLEEFSKMYIETMQRLNARESYYYDLAYFRSMMESRSFETRLYVAKLGSALCATALFVKCGPIFQYHLSCSRDGIAKYPATKLLLAEACRQAAQDGCTWAHLGGGLGGQEDSLYAFKMAFGGETMPFAVWKWVIDSEKYERLNESSGHDGESHSTFFPSYRAQET